MTGPLVAIVGNLSQTTDAVAAKRAAEELGSELARQGWRLLVYSPGYVEADFVRGYTRSRAGKSSACVEIRYPPKATEIFEEEKTCAPLFRRIPQGPDWEISFYPTLVRADAVIVLGGGYTTKVAGLIALGANRPILALGGFGGAAYQVWESLRSERGANMLTEEELGDMATPNWNEQSARRCVRVLQDQWERRLRSAEKRDQLTSEGHRQRALARFAIIGAALFTGVLAAIAESQSTDALPRSILYLLLLAPALAGASGAAIRVVYDYWRQEDLPASPKPFLLTIVLGFWASGVAGGLLVIPQIFAAGKLATEAANRLLPFAASVGLIAGLTLDRVFPRLIKVDVPIAPLEVQKTAAAGGAK
jgi:hypothetical protein